MAEFVGGFVEKNFPTILNIAKEAFSSVDATLQVSIRTAYTKYLEDSYAKYSVSRTFFVRDLPVDLYDYYVPARINAGKTIIEEPGAMSSIQFSNRVIINGSAGSGKSILAKHIFLDGLKSDGYAPVLIELRRLNEEGANLKDLIAKSLESFNFKSSQKYFEKANKAGHFYYILDGYDEVAFEKRAALLSDISSLGGKYKNCPILITSRPEEDLDGLTDFHVYSIMPLELEQALELVGRLPVDIEVGRKFCFELKKRLFREKQSFLSNPLLLSIMLLTYGENAEIPQKKSIFYQQAFDALFRRHDSYKGGFSRARRTSLDSVDFSKAFSTFALQTYESRMFKLSRKLCLEYFSTCRKATGLEFSPEGLLHDSLKAVCLLVEDGLDIAYVHRSFQEYFVACYICAAPPEVQNKLIARYGGKHDSDDVIDLLYEMNPNLVERVLIIPYAKALFLRLNIVEGVVNAEHVVKYISEHYKSMVVRPTSISFTSKNTDPKLRLLKILAISYGGYVFPPREHFLDFYADLRETLNVPEDEDYVEDDLSMNSYSIQQIMDAKGFFSTYYFQSVLDGFKVLEKKHAENINVLNDLLGLS